MSRPKLILPSTLALALAAGLPPSAAVAAEAEAAQSRGGRDATGLPLRDGRVGVNTTADGVDADPGDGRCGDARGRCTLRAAVMEANARRDATRISLQNRRYRLTVGGAGEDGARSGDLDVTGRVTLIGRGALVDAARGDRAFDVAPGARLSTATARRAQAAGSRRWRGRRCCAERRCSSTRPAPGPATAAVCTCPAPAPSTCATRSSTATPPRPRAAGCGTRPPAA